uniref:Uncharacterized protein n=1 Tax=Siphoviridae sp. ctxMM9 TaxID=2827973 RepID=A0A8S5T842_9CAUD|nr:MAG TPA: hypothetical protein [Siphoviridae sp. ctxMM9]
MSKFTPTKPYASANYLADSFKASWPSPVFK